MNAKKVKQIRRAVRFAAANLRQVQVETSYIQVGGAANRIDDPVWGNDTVLLHPHCVRALIQAAKKDAEVQEKLHG